ncbi:hypothetical protein DFQ14_113108 [Halopolyspora algeriensis]|uniref:DUF885 domain-containing protein n=1 Tax=Halopolyspora algeriensis TaxID=1500506 RepID=A0A368VLX5_9ACTN|nr:DUF885 domain-containing protein [Halopolyspora algeriensis]RCW40025.1 hypothetical protein DFQ14_113108 [Halopolyspora algeriensis]
MDARTLVTEYLLLGLRFDRLAAGFVDCYTGDPELRRRVRDEPRPDPARLVTAAERLRAALAETDLAETDPCPGVLPRQRRTFLDAQLAALECSGRILAGERISFRAEVEAYFQIPIEPGDRDSYRQAHAELAEALPGRGPLHERLAAAREAECVPAEKLDPCVRALSEALRTRVRGSFALPAQEHVEYRVVTGRPWSGLHSYLGDYRSRVAVNADSPHRVASLTQLIAHEAYPGHHTQHCRRDGRSPDGTSPGRGSEERTLSLVNTPQCLISEGLADLGLHVALGPGWGEWAAEVLGDQGLHPQGAQVERLVEILDRLRPVRQDAALMLHEQAADESEVTDYLQRWLLIPRERARRMVDFLAHPLWRAYTSTYVEGYRLLRSWLHARMPAAAPEERYRRLLDEPLVPQSLRAELAGGRHA